MANAMMLPIQDNYVIVRNEKYSKNTEISLYRFINVPLSPGTRWLDISVTNNGDGVPIPAHIADKLRGREFRT
ncbi:hypothetical protein [Superficieibacter sp. HKU1]|uniref:hypothetical protein n=1 Tax=Superficieibacter sp. HKU1 TaxID=3031919 RepID=UPI0023E320EC|nr:hypothetical protein [Superficieibacter sp. HKU1]WES69318.1 hypothetical protein P0H77_04730 [Superficieibacter sp. HKU1]